MATPNWIDITRVGTLQAALDVLPPEGGTVYVPAGTYDLDRPVTKVLAEHQHLLLVGDGRSSVLANRNTHGDELLRITGVPGSWWPNLRITIRDLSFVGTGASGDGLVVEYPNDTLIDACFFIGHGGQAVRLTPHGTNVTVRDSWMRDCRHGVRADNIHHLTLHGNQTRSLEGGQTQDEHVWLSWHCREVRIVNNHFAYGRHQGIVLDGTAQHVIANNTIEGFAVAIDARGVGVEGARDRCRDIVVNANYVHADVGIRLAGPCKGFAITGNDFINNPLAAVQIEQADGGGCHTITGNAVRKSVYDGTFVTHCIREQGGFALGDAESCVVNGNLLDGLHPGPAISAGPGGGRHVITANRIVGLNDPAIAVHAPGCLVHNNLLG